jgi:hypothetical protein
MIINLITEDFKGSRYTNIEDCPLVRALKRYFPNKRRIVASDSFVRFGIRTIYDFDYADWDSHMVEELIDKANAGETVEYQLEIPGL